MAFDAALAPLRNRLARLSGRERSLLAGAGVALVFFVVLLVGYFIADGLGSLRDHNREVGKALKQMILLREPFLAQRRKLAAFEARMTRESPELPGYLAAKAQEAGIKDPEINELPEAPRGGRYLEKSATLKLPRVGLDGLAKFLRGVESSTHPVIISRLLVRTRYNQHEELDAEMTVATYKRASTAPSKRGGRAGTAGRAAKGGRP